MVLQMANRHEAPAPGVLRRLMPVRHAPELPRPAGGGADRRQAVARIAAIHGFGYNPMNDGGRYSIQSPFVSNLPPAWSTLPPPITDRPNLPPRAGGCAGSHRSSTRKVVPWIITKGPT